MDEWRNLIRKVSVQQRSGIGEVLFAADEQALMVKAAQPQLVKLPFGSSFHLRQIYHDHIAGVREQRNTGLPPCVGGADIESLGAAEKRPGAWPEFSHEDGLQFAEFPLIAHRANPNGVPQQWSKQVCHEDIEALDRDHEEGADQHT